MNQVNLINWRQRRIKQRIRNDTIYLVIMTLIGVMILALSFNAYDIKITTQKEWLVVIKQSLSQQQQHIDSLKQLQSTVSQQAALVEQLAQYHAGKSNTLDLFLTIEQAIPPQVWLNHVALDQQKISLHGYSSRYPSIIGFANALAEQPLLYDLRMESIQLLPMSTSDNKRFSYLIRASWSDNDQP